MQVIIGAIGTYEGGVRNAMNSVLQYVLYVGILVPFPSRWDSI